MFTYERPVFLRDTDATGVIYFASIFQYVLEAFEVYLLGKGFSLSKIFELGYLMPVVHAEADYKAPLKAGDRLFIEISIGSIGEKSFSIQSIVYLSEKKVAASSRVVHAFVKKGEMSSSPIPKELLDILLG